MAGDDDDQNRVERPPAGMEDGGWTEEAVEGLRGVLLMTPPGRLAEASQVLQSLRQMANQQRIIESAEMLGTGLGTPMDVHVASVHAFSRMNAGTFILPLDNIPSSGPGRTAALKAIADTERADPGSFSKMMQGDAQARETYQNAVDKAVADPGSVEEPSPTESVTTGHTDGQVRVSGRCQPIRICFWPGAKFRNNPKLRREYMRQLQLQEQGINAMPPGRLAANRATYCNPASRPAAEAASSASRRVVRKAYEKLYRQRLRLLNRGPLAATIPGKVRRHMSGVAVLHNPDAIAGGSPVVSLSGGDVAAVAAGTPVGVIGDRGVNSSIGRLWGGCASPNSNSSKLARHAEQQDRNGCPSTQADLDICRD